METHNPDKNSSENTESMDTEENFADLFEDSFVEEEMLEPGQIIESEIIKISDDLIFIHLSGKSEGHLEAIEFKDENGNLTVKEGDKINAYFMSSKNGELYFTTKIKGDKAGRAVLENAFESEIPVEGSVVKEIKGGYEVKLGESRSFCPYSQMGLDRIENPEQYIDKLLSFRITEFSENGRNIIVSHRIILEEERKIKIETLKETLQVGIKVNGIIKSIQKFGAFVDIDGVQALLPISHISRSRVDNINEILSIGQEVEAAIIDLDWDSNKITLSIKEILPDPWDEVSIKYKEGSRYNGKIARTTNFGAFVTLEPGLDGLIHISDLGGGTRIKHPREVVKDGQTIEVLIGSIDLEKKRISLSPISDEPVEEDYKQYSEKIDNSYKPMGSLGDLLKGKIDKESK